MKGDCRGTSCAAVFRPACWHLSKPSLLSWRLSPERACLRLVKQRGFLPTGEPVHCLCVQVLCHLPAASLGSPGEWCAARGVGIHLFPDEGSLTSVSNQSSGTAIVWVPICRAASAADANPDGFEYSWGGTWAITWNQSTFTALIPKNSVLRRVHSSSDKHLTCGTGRAACPGLPSHLSRRGTCSLRLAWRGRS